ncbi:MAG TPA: MEDS domain-containing protein [Candidatus Binatia bacterium]|nr:MEDS domain-containing protein [Candidatus Binatia bacterium]
MQDCGSHFVQFHNNSVSLAKEVAGFVAAGLREEEGVIVIATAEHTTLIVQQLIAAGLSAAAAEERGQLRILDADVTLASFMRLTLPDWPRFRDTIAPEIAALRDRGFKKIRAYGEMVDILWRNGNTSAAIRLEDYWNDLGQIYSFSLLCAYLLDGLSESSYAGPLNEIGRAHSAVLTGEDDERLQRAIDSASESIFGTHLSRVLALVESRPGEHRLPPGRRTVMWLKRTMPLKVSEILARARHHIETEALVEAAAAAEEKPPLKTV